MLCDFDNKKNLLLNSFGAQHNPKCNNFAPVIAKAVHFGTQIS